MSTIVKSIFAYFQPLKCVGECLCFCTNSFFAMYLQRDDSLQYPDVCTNKT